jgi:hypothetical protein
VSEGWSGERRPTCGTELLRSALGPCRNGQYGRQLSPVLIDGAEEPQVVGSTVQADGIMQVSDSDCGPEGQML